MKTQNTQLNIRPRRNFLKLLFAGSASTCAAKISADESPSQSTTDTVEQQATDKGYRLTSHIEKYYRKAEF